MITQRKPLKAKNKKTYIAFILDKSGSMDSLVDATISSFNEQLQDHRANESKGGEILLSLVQFNSAVEETFFNTPISQIEGEFDRSQYQPSGGTAMYDAIGYTLNKLQRSDEAGNIAFLVIILSDGAENSSKKFTGAQISSLKKELEETGRWTFQYIGCDSTAIKEAVRLGFHSASFVASSEGLNNLSAQLNYSNTSFYNARATDQTRVEHYLSNPDEINKD